MDVQDPVNTRVLQIPGYTPPGWSYNPSTWRERGPLLALAGIGLLISVVLTAYQIGLLPEPWDPIFGPASSARVLHSPIAELLPVPDASLGALGYAAEIILGAIGGRARWRTAPGIVLLFGLVALGLGLVSMLLLVLQGSVVHSWCALCLASAAISIFVLSMEPGEALATAQQVKRAHASGLAWWPALLGQAPWLTEPKESDCARAIGPDKRTDATSGSAISLWAQIISLLLGVWLLIAPDALGYGDPARTVERAIAPVVIVVAAVALRQVTRPVRRLNALTGLALLLAPWVFAYASIPAIVNSILAGMALLGLAFAGNGAQDEWNGGWSSLWESDTTLDLSDAV